MKSSTWNNSTSLEQAQLTKLKTLSHVLEYIHKVPPRYNPIKRGFTQQLLLAQEQLGLVDKKALLAYLQDPYCLMPSWTKDEFNKKIQRVRTENKEEDFRSYSCYFKPSDNDLITRCLKRLFKTENNITEFEEFMDPSQLRKLYWQVKLQNGETCPNPKEFFSDEKLEELFNQRELRFVENNKNNFKSGEHVEVILSIKNVSRLMVRIFEVNTLNYIMEKNNQDYETIDVSGLIPSGEFEHKYTNNPIIIHEEKFEFKNIQSCETGVFIVDFIGEEVKARCVLYKGQLNLVFQGVHGRSCVIHDQNGNVCKGQGTGLYIGDTFFQADLNSGVISIPINIASVDRDVVTLHKGFADLCRLKTKEPNTGFIALVVYNSEEFIAGNQVTFAIEPRLTMFNEPASLSFITKLNVTVNTTNDVGVVNVTNFKDLAVVDNKDVLVDFIFPPKVTHIRVCVDAEIKIGEQTKPQEFEMDIPIDRKLNQDIYDLFFQKNHNGELTLFVLGKNGEPRKKIMIPVQIKVKHSNDVKTFQLVSDEKGCCHFGVIENLEYIEAGQSVVNKYFELDSIPSQTEYPEQILLTEKEQLELPLLAEKDTIFFFLLDHKNKIKEEVNRSHYSISNDKLHILGLHVGVYLLKIGNQCIQLNVIKQHIKTDSLLWTDSEIYARPHKNKVWFSSKKEKDDHFEVKVVSGRDNLRARLLTYNFLPIELSRFLESQVKNCNKNKPGFDTFPIKNFVNTFTGQKRMNDELIYVYDRRTKKTFMGNTLEKPGVILKRAKVGDTVETDQVVNPGAVDDRVEKMYAQRAQTQQMAQAYLSRQTNYLYCGGNVRINEFLGNPGKLTAGVEVKDGVIKIPKSSIAAHAFSFLWISDGVNGSILPISTENKQTVLRDITLQQSRKDGYIYAYSRKINFLKANETQSIENISNTEIFMITSLKELFGCYQTLNKDNGLSYFKEWEFIHCWAALSPMDKIKKYDKYASHELNLFLYFKDNDFFVEVVKPFIENKKEKTVVDYFLLDKPECCNDLYHPGFVESANLLEKILIAVLAKKHNPQFSQSVLNMFKLKSAVNKLSTQDYKQLFETLLNASSESVTTINRDELIERAENIESEMYAQPDTMMFTQNVKPAFQPVQAFSNMAPSNARLRGGPMRSYGKKESAIIQKNVSYEQEECYNDALFGEKECDYDVYQEKKEIFTKPQGTIEYRERQYFDEKFYSDVSDFWTDALSHLLANDSNANFGSKNFLKSVLTFPELIVALALTDLPFEKAKYESKVTNNTLNLKVHSNILILSKEIIERKGEKMDLEVLCSQKIFDPNDPVIYDDEDPELFFDKPVDEFLTNKVYALRVVITNSTTTQLKLDLIIEIPAGSIPVDSMDSLLIKNLTIQQFHSEVVELRFYFPKSGTFPLFPATVVSNNKIVSSARKVDPLVVKSEKTLIGLKTLSDVLSNGSIDDIIEFIKSKNLLNTNIFSFDWIYWLLKNESFYEKLLKICEEKGIYDNIVWSFSIVHGDFKRLKQFLQLKRNSFAPFLKFHSSPLYETDDFSVREFYPLINPRAHVLGDAKTNIINSTFKKTYNTFLTYLFQKFTPSSDDWVLLINYLIAQDQIEKALELSRKLGPNLQVKATTRIQLDYQTAYLNFITGYPDFQQAKSICEKYLTHPVLSVRNLFVEMVNQLAEFEESGVQLESDIQREGELLNKAKSQKIASFSTSLEEKQVKLVSTLIGQFVLKFYKVEVEVIFSINPFNFESKKSFSHVSPFLETVVNVNDDNELTVTRFDIPANLLEENLFIEVRSLNEKVKKSEFMTYVPFRINCVLSKEIGILKCFDQKSNKPVPKIYVKCFTKIGGSVSFYKDGYTDLRGSFDYVSLNSDKVDKIESFAILVTSPEFGSKIFIESPPKKIGTEEGQAKKLISKGWENIRQQNEEKEVMEDVQRQVKKKYAYVY
jgi:hypothetical protein